MEDTLKFLKEYQELCQKYKMGLRGCGCCGSPYLWNADRTIDIDDVNYNEEKNIVQISDTSIDELLDKKIK